MGSKELSSPHVQLPSSFENISDCKPLWCGLWICAELKTRLAPNSQTFLNYPREKKKKDHPCSQEVSCCGSMWDPVLPLHLANWEWQWESNKYKPHSQSLTTTTKCLQPNLGLIYLWMCCTWVLLRDFYCPSYQPGSQNTDNTCTGRFSWKPHV